ncbi:MAG: HU-CCDC81 and SPOR domain-containing protein [Croceitalea sp.]|nr:HU-CCDC81 and SPOR domain-containing protein [Croceitalea sp.]
MRIEHYIEELLYRYNCVVLPEFGAFLAQRTSARIDAASNTIHPPAKSISFNQQLAKNDGLLVSHIAKAKKLSYEDILNEVLETSKLWHTKLAKGEQITLKGIGDLNLNRDGNIEFIPEENINYLTSSFGLSAFAAAPIIREELKEEITAIEDRTPITFTPEKRETASLRPLLKYAAVTLLILATGLAGYQSYQQNIKLEQVALENAQEQVSKHIQEATFFDTIPLELPSLTLNIDKIVKPTGPQHHIIAGAFRIKENADKKVEQLKTQGYNAQYIGANAYGLHQVVYASFSDSREALQYLRTIKRTVTPDAWMLSIK